MRIGDDEDEEARTIGQVRQGVDDLGDVAGEDEILVHVSIGVGVTGAGVGGRLEGKCRQGQRLTSSQKLWKVSVRYRHIKSRSEIFTWPGSSSDPRRIHRECLCRRSRTLPWR